ncbi:hypothetical protein AWB80_02854 [Caballeronia pedi]|uniref:Uncharacterized protein n=1 Tax=Caballeronia pedi TaxID=1777141 RepID=A0A158B030_9BURK|nr:hypothetical protein [Caballeronia pedi]SAK63343.1 hypothetical protein AWB80_02854 [Caballeronia pedi]
MTIYYSSDVLVTEFARFAKANIPEDASESQRLDMQRAFFGGVLIMMNLHQGICDLPDHLAVAAIHALQAEAVSFAKAQTVIARMSSEPHDHD